MQTHAINDIDELVNRLVLKSVLGRSDILSGGGVGSCEAGARWKGEMIGDIVDSAVGSGQYNLGSGQYKVKRGGSGQYNVGSGQYKVQRGEVRSVRRGGLVSTTR